MMSKEKNKDLLELNNLRSATHEEKQEILKSISTNPEFVDLVQINDAINAAAISLDLSVLNRASIPSKTTRSSKPKKIIPPKGYNEYLTKISEYIKEKKEKKESVFPSDMSEDLNIPYQTSRAILKFMAQIGELIESA